MDSASQLFFTFMSPAFRVLPDRGEGAEIVCELYNQMVTAMMAWNNRSNDHISESTVLYYAHVELWDVHTAIKETGERPH